MYSPKCLHIAGKMMRLVLPPLLLLLLPPPGQMAPKDGGLRLDAAEWAKPLPNPFQPGQEQLRLLQTHLKGLEQAAGDPEHMDREQVLLYLLALHDYDQSGRLDGLELLDLLGVVLTPRDAAPPPSTSQVIDLVDTMLETRDFDGDGLLTPAELLALPGDTPEDQEDQDSLAPVLLGSEQVGEEVPEPAIPLEQRTGETGELGEAVRPSKEALELTGEAEQLGGAEGEAEGLGEATGGRGEDEGPGEGASEQGKLQAEFEENVPEEAHSVHIENEEM
ncbi:cell growth regulator with EF hand domain protein 1 [Tachyglossus aculeatus]|uniref:cell growth regulator with EF hand domain protein 1 n=1 Tax=Tachyglossus aculeatus TaxID=9261 RepID=UPI0018F7926D|nr:cell growth regulator with EF hand domain protein 1 [Tachyglossus aculeatus]